MKKIWLVILAFIMVMLVGCAKTSTTDVFRFEVRKIVITTGESKQLGLILGDINEDTYIVYEAKSKDESIDPYTIVKLGGSSTTTIEGDTTYGKDEKVSVTGLQPGVIQFTAYVKESPNVKDTIVLEVADVAIDYLKINNEESTLYIGEQLQLETTYSPSNAKVNLQYQTSNENIVKISETGLMTAISEGSVDISVSSKDDSEIIAKKTVRVVYLKTTEIQLEANEISITKGEKYQINPVALPEGSKQDGFTYVSSVLKVALVDKAGLVTARDAGETIITITSSDGVQTTLKIIVGYSQVTSLEIDKDQIDMEVGKNARPKALMNIVILPDDANQEVSCELLSGEGIVEVKGDPVKIYALDEGTAVVRISAGAFSKDITVNVKKPAVTSVSVLAKQISIEVNEELNIVDRLKISLLPKNAPQDYLISLTSGNEFLSYDDTTKIIKGLANGEAKLTIATPDGKIKQEIAIIVFIKPTDFTITGAQEGTVDKTTTEFIDITIDLLPVGASGDILAESSDQNVIEVMVDGTTVSLTIVGVSDEVIITITVGDIVKTLKYKVIETE